MNTLDKLLKDYFSKMGQRGGVKRMAALTKEEKRSLSMKGVQARWKKYSGKKFKKILDE